MDMVTIIENVVVRRQRKTRAENGYAKRRAATDEEYRRRRREMSDASAKKRVAREREDAFEGYLISERIVAEVEEEEEVENRPPNRLTLPDDIWEDWNPKDAPAHVGYKYNPARRLD
jgi:hypothetical protein